MRVPLVAIGVRVVGDDERSAPLHARVDCRAAQVAQAHLVAALESGLPGCAGVALGVDRLLMALLDTPRIADVLAFEFARA